MRKLAKLLPYLVLLLLIVVALAIFVLRAGPLAEHLRKVITGELARQTNRQVSIGRVSVSLSGRVSLYDLEVRNQDGSPLLTAPRAVARVGRPGSRFPLLSGPTEVQEVRLLRPEVTLARASDGAWSIADLVTREPEAPPRFQGNVLVDDGTLTIVDQTRGGAVTKLDQADLTLRYPRPGEAVFSLRARSADEGFESLQAKGRTDAAAHTTTLSGTISDLDLAYALDRLPEVTFLDLPSGRADLQGEFSTAPRDSPETGPRYRLQADVREAALEFPWLARPIIGVQGRVVLAEGEVRLDGLTGMLEEAPIKADGIISDLADPQLAIDLSVSGLRYKQLKSLLPKIYVPATLALPAPMRVTARVEGPASDVSVSGRAEVRVVKFRLVPWNDVVAKFRYSHGRLKISGLSAHGSPRRLDADLDVAWGEGPARADANLSLSDVPLSLLAQMAGLDGTGLEGTASITAVASVDGGRSASGHITIRDARIRGLPVGHIAADFSLSDQALIVSRATVHGPMATGSLSGRMAFPQRLLCEASFQTVDFAVLASALGQPGLHGSSPATVSLSGTLDGPHLSAHISLGPGEVQGARFDALTIALGASPQRLRLSELNFTSPGASCQGELEMTDWQTAGEDASIGGQLRLDRVLLREWLSPSYAAVIPAVALEGVVDVTGTRRDPRLEMDLQVQSPTVFGLPLELGRAALRYEDGRLLIDRASFSDPHSRLVVTGSYAEPTGLALRFEADPLDLASVNGLPRQLYGVLITGQLLLTGEITGPLSGPVVTFSAASQSVAINGVQSQQFALSGRLQEGVLHLDSALLELPDASLSVAGDVRLSPVNLDLTFNVARLDLVTVLTVIDRSLQRLYPPGTEVPHLDIYLAIPWPLGGRFTVAGDISGPVSDPVVDLREFVVDRLTFAGREIERIEAGDEGITLSRSMIRFDLEATHDIALISLKGEVAPKGDLSVRADILNLDLSLLGPFLEYEGDIAGQAAINFDIEGRTSEPVVRGDLHVDNLRLDALRLEVADASLTLSGSPILLFRNHGRSRFAGLVAPPVAELHVRNAQLGSLLGMSVKDVQADIFLEGDKILVAREIPLEAAEPVAPGIRGKIGSGSFTVAGDVVLESLRASSWNRNRYDLTCDLDAVQIALNDAVDARLSGSLLLTNDPSTGRALLTTPQGEHLIVSNSTFGIPKQMPAVAVGAAFPFSPDLRVKVLVGEGVRFLYGAHSRPTEIIIDPADVVDGGVLSGYLDIRGRLSATAFTLDGQAESHAGQLAFPNSMFTLRRAEAWIHPDPRGRHGIWVSAHADGRVGDYYISLNPAGQVYSMGASQEGEEALPPIPLNADSIPPLDYASILALLRGAVAAPTRADRRDMTSLLATPGASGPSPRITGIMLPAFGSARGTHQLSLDVDFQGPLLLRVGERIFDRFVVSYISALSGPGEARTLRVSYEINPSWSLGWSVDELDRTRLEAQAFVPF